VICEGSRDTEDWINDAANSALHHINTFYFKLFWCIINQHQRAHETLKNKIKTYQPQSFRYCAFWDCLLCEEWIWPE